MEDFSYFSYFLLSLRLFFRYFLQIKSRLTFLTQCLFFESPKIIFYFFIAEFCIVLHSSWSVNRGERHSRVIKSAIVHRIARNAISASIAIVTEKYRGITCFSVCDRSGFRERLNRILSGNRIFVSTKNERQDLLIGWPVKRLDTLGNTAKRRL